MNLVGVGLRPEDVDQGATPVMSFPIYPAVDHPTGREPFRPEPSFPFVDCYHWCGTDMKVSLRVKNGEFTRDMNKLVWLPDYYAIVFNNIGAQDAYEMHSYQRWRNAPPELEAPQRDEQTAVRPVTSTSYSADTQGSILPETYAPDGGSPSLRSDWGEDEDEDLKADLFDLDDEWARYPIVELSTDLTGQLTQESIPDALEFARQYQTLSSYVLCANVRLGVP